MPKKLLHTFFRFAHNLRPMRRNPAEVMPVEESQHFTVKVGVTLPKCTVSLVAAFARDFYQVAGIDIVITSARRSEAEQAASMYNNMAKGVNSTKLYRQYAAAKEVQDAYDAAVSLAKSEEQTTMEIEAVLKAQTARGIFISDHMRDNAVDIRCRGMTVQQMEDFRAVASKHCKKTLLESKADPHWHLEF